MFPRWMNGTCLEAAPKLVPEQDEPVRFTFFSDVQLHPMVLELATTVQHNIQKGVTEVLRYLAGWKRKYKPLWRMQMVRGDRASHCKLQLERGSLGGRGGQTVWFRMGFSCYIECQCCRTDCIVQGRIVHCPD